MTPVVWAMRPRYRRLPDCGHPLTEYYAEQLYVYTPDSDVAPELHRTCVWERETPELREGWRVRARRFLAGDLSMLPWTRPIGWKGEMPPR